MSKIIDLTGQRFGRLTVIGFAEIRNQKSYWKCKCDCENIKIINSYSLKSGKTKSCGCLRKETTKKRGKRNIKHNKTNTRLYRIWTGMKSRCYYNKNIEYKNYGGRGITICDEWLDNFMNFYNWAINNGYDDKLTIDRMNNNGDYEPQNCRWVNMKKQENNRHNNRIIKYKRKTYTLSELSDLLKIPSATLKWRLDNNWNEDQLNLKVNFGNSKIRKEGNKNEQSSINGKINKKSRSKIYANK